MKNRIMALACVCLCACTEAMPVAQDSVPLPEGDRSACQVQSVPTPRINREALTTGVNNNAVRIHEGVAWIVHSGSHTIGRLALATGSWDPDFVDLGQDAQSPNPWDLTFAKDKLYITNFLADSVSVVDALTGSVLGEVPLAGLSAPGTPAAGGGLLVVPGTGFASPDYAEAHIAAWSLLDEAPWLAPLGVWETRAKNTSLAVYDDARDRFYVVSTGALGRDPQGLFVPLTDGAVEVLDAAALREGQEKSATLASIAVPRAEDPFAGAPRDLIMGAEGRYAYLPSSSSPHLYKVDLETLTLVRPPANPVVAYVGDGNQLTGAALGPAGVILVTAYNQDALYVVDPSCDHSVAGPFELGTGPFLEGALFVDWDEGRGQALVLMNLSNRLVTVKGLRF